MWILINSSPYSVIGNWHVSTNPFKDGMPSLLNGKSIFGKLRLH